MAIESHFQNLVNQRFSARDYLDQKVEREKIELCLEAARLAPSACNSQPWRFIIIDDPSLKNRIISIIYFFSIE